MGHTNASPAIIGRMSIKIALPAFLALCLALTACAPAAATLPPPPASATSVPPTSTVTPTDTPTSAPPTDTPLPTATDTQTPVPVVESLNATVNANLLSCRYGPGPEYLYLDGFREGLKITLIGQTGGNNWVWVKGDIANCWVNIKFLKIDGDFKTLPVVYPDIARLPRSSYYPPTTIVSATRNGNEVTITWVAVPISPGDYEDENMFNYIVEVWRCEGGQIIFDPLATNWTSITVIDEPGCALPSHGRVFVQEKHGFAGPAEIAWP